MPRLALAFCLLLTPLLAQVRPQLVYTARVLPDDRESFHFEVTVHRPPQEVLHFAIPYWAPGAYRPITVGVRGGEPSWKQLMDLTAVDGTGRPLAVEPAGDRRWAVDARGKKSVTLRYRNADPSHRRNNRSYLVEDCGLIDGPRSWVYLEGHLREPAHVHFDLPEGWEIATGLDPTFDPRTYHAKSYDHLADCPTMVGSFERWTFHHRGVPHRVVLDAGGAGEIDHEAFVEVCRRIVEVYVELWGDIPYEHYTFLFVNGGGGGLEHLTSTTIGTRPFLLRRNPAASKGVTAHEFFHAWNVKRLRPRRLGPFDYSGPQPVKDLWICEGLTSYYTVLGLWRCGLSSTEEFLEGYRGLIRSHEANPASRWLSPQESSLSVWDGWPAVSYYSQGEMLGLLLDLHLRDGSDNRHSLDEVMREMYRRYGGYYRSAEASPGYRSEDWIEVTREITGIDVGPFFRDHVERAKPIPWNDFLAVAGWELVHEELERPALAALSLDSEGRVPPAPGASVLATGLRPGDRILSLDTQPFRNARRLRRTLSRARVGGRMPCTVERDGERVEIMLDLSVVASETLASDIRAGEDGLRLNGLAWGGTLREAGLREGDVLIAVNGVRGDPLALRSTWRGAPVGEPLEVIVRRGDEMQTLTTRPLEPFRVRAVRDLVEVESPTPRQLHLREGLRMGHLNPVP